MDAANTKIINDRSGLCNTCDENDKYTVEADEMKNDKQNNKGTQSHPNLFISVMYKAIKIIYYTSYLTVVDKCAIYNSKTLNKHKL